MIVLLVAALGCATAIVWLAMWLLPVLMIDENAYITESGDLDQAAIENAYNAVRVPISVTSAAFLAAAAAIAGVWINARTVAVARDALTQTRWAEDERRRQWAVNSSRSGSTTPQFSSEPRMLRSVWQASTRWHVSLMSGPRSGNPASTSSVQFPHLFDEIIP